MRSVLLFLVFVALSATQTSSNSFIRDSEGNCIFPTQLANHPPGASAVSQTCAGFEVAVTNSHTIPTNHTWDFTKTPGEERQNLLERSKELFIGMDNSFTMMASNCGKNEILNGSMIRTYDQGCIDMFKQHLYANFLHEQYTYTLIGVSVPSGVPENSWGDPIRCLQLDNQTHIEWGMQEIARRHSLFRYTEPPSPYPTDICRSGDTWIIELHSDINHPTSIFHLGNPIPVNATGDYELYGKFTGILVKEGSQPLRMRLAQLANHLYHFKYECKESNNWCKKNGQ